MKHLLALLLLFSFSAFAKEWNSGAGHISPQAKAYIDRQIKNDKADSYNLRQLRPDPQYESSYERKQRIDAEYDDYYDSLH